MRPGLPDRLLTSRVRDTIDHRDQLMADVNATSKRIIANIERVIIGKRQEIMLVLAALWTMRGPSPCPKHSSTGS